MKLSLALADVRAFHQAFEHPVAFQPTPMTYDRAVKRAGWGIDEGNELIEDTAEVERGMAEGKLDEADLIAVQVDASLDAIYFAIGNLVELGINPDPLWDIVQTANMAKLHEINGERVAVKKDGKVVKPDGWQDPHPLIVAEVRRQIAVARAPLAATA